MTDAVKPTNLPYEDFAKLDIRVGTIQRAELVPKSKKLLRLEVFFGNAIGVRTILSGIAESYDPTRMGGIQIVAILNLAPRVMMGIQSDGMLLATRDDKGVRLVLPFLNTVEGTEVG